VASRSVISNCPSDVPPGWPASPLAGFVDTVVFSSRVGLTKPDPASYEIALEQLSVEATECLYIGDGAGDELNGARSIGMRPVHLRYPGIPEQRPWGAAGRRRAMPAAGLWRWGRVELPVQGH